jgi:hypothetical protein
MEFSFRLILHLQTGRLLPLRRQLLFNILVSAISSSTILSALTALDILYSTTTLATQIVHQEHTYQTESASPAHLNVPKARSGMVISVFQVCLNAQLAQFGTEMHV